MGTQHYQSSVSYVTIATLVWTLRRHSVHPTEICCVLVLLAPCSVLRAFPILLASPRLCSCCWLGHANASGPHDECRWLAQRIVAIPARL
jgi:hypothetical protein